MAGDGERWVGGACFGFIVRWRIGGRAGLRLLLWTGRGSSGSVFGCRGGEKLERMRSVERRGRFGDGHVVCCEEHDAACDREERLRRADSSRASLSASSKIWMLSRCVAGT